MAGRSEKILVIDDESRMCESLSELLGGSGYKVVKEIDPETIVILMTGYASLESALEAIKNGAFEYLLKPVEFTQLEISVRRGLEKREASLARKELLDELKRANYNLNNRLQEINALYEAGKSLGYTTDNGTLLEKIVAN